jgi:regulator of protease activity HflC (stomatin/prohibitin superfamily)
MSNNVYETSAGMPGNLPPGSALQPEQALHEDQLTPEWYMQNARYIANQYNPVLFNFQSVSGLQNNDIVQRWASRSIIWYSYYFGNQQVADYSSVVMDEQNNVLPIRMFKDQTISTLINHMLGNVKDVINVLPDIVSAIGLSEDIVSAKQLKMDMAKFKFDYPEVAEQMRSMGAEIMKGLNFSQEDELINHFQENAKEMAEEIYENLAVDSMYKNKWREVYSLAARDAFVVGVGCVRVIVDNERAVNKRVAPHNLIWDSSITSTQNRGGRYAGEIYQMTTPEIAARWGDQLGFKRLQEIEHLSRNQRFQQPFNIMLPNTNLIFWAQGAAGVPLATIVETEWIGFKELAPGKFTATRRKATLIANKYVVDYGECDNIVEDKFNPSDTELSFKIVTPVIEYGYAQGVTEKLYRMSDLLSMYRTKMIQLIARSKGKNYILRAWKLPEAMRTQDIMADFTRMGMTVLNDASEEDDPNTKLVEPVDMTMDPTVIGLINVLGEMKSVMEDVASLPAGVRGATSGYQSAKSLNINKAQSNKGIQVYYDAVFEFFENVINYTTEVSKQLATRGELYNASMIIGDKQVKWLKFEAKDLKFSDLMIQLKLDDATNAQEKAEILADVAQAVNRGELSGMDLLKLRMMNSKRKMFEYLRGRYKQNELRALAKEQADRATQEAINERNAQAQENATATAAQAGLEKQALANQGQIQKEAVKVGAQSPQEMPPVQ